MRVGVNRTPEEQQEENLNLIVFRSNLIVSTVNCEGLLPVKWEDLLAPNSLEGIWLLMEGFGVVSMEVPKARNNDPTE